MKEVVEQCRSRLVRAEPGEACRLFHGRGHCYPGYENLVVNWLPPCLQVVFFNDVDEHEVSETVDRLQAELAEVTTIGAVIVQYRRGRGTVSEVLYGAVDEEIEVLEEGLRYVVQPLRNQHVGLFMDMAHIRTWLAPRVAGKRVLNLFAYTCAFSVSAVAHGASLVVNNDMAKNKPTCWLRRGCTT